MKHWIANYSVKCKDGHEVEVEATNIEANSILEALEVVKRDHTEPLKGQPNVECVIIWNIGIIDDDVFPEEGEDYDQ